MKSDTIIISIHPVFVDKILSGKKKYEFRKHLPKDVRYMLVYTTSPVKRITALVEIDSIITDTPDIVWRKTRKQAGVSKVFFDSYFRNKPIAYAAKFKRVHELSTPILINNLKGIKNAPQSYIYLQEPINTAIELDSKHDAVHFLS